ncbi:acetyl/propionyl/methylcrotonyl-CoA carboxylase subunit alpha [Methyloversatilis sp.]|uniref:acetyl-CoA carboxylase biotin carboxylase subunit n=1 Tax=Methyloversatilis sp. TaxID=2569862 RepID=UPI002733750A|nr:acetyl/propionyl/methylcrotonyl-CoA carboxylase subunit alpha [Methyloversatilis sp.]MDP2795512.1 acetyl/propionyl/methylcrotonyl-CoA carboxylase subunit alpha [Sulfurisoma sp.]MDP3457145.1 acetyl/propionyl/methylcrotonyl-CoA carboxylase subunit alpha [Methyloversatilis sp.]MDP3576768.1 acetyl/propionyl/methylcrotonyl-CoA carboxylase subunit alpha [Methyloversatilis sp.]
MFKKILIANRGEIACRVIRTARRMGIATVAVYSEADRAALHVELADEAVCIGPAAARESYLVIDKIIAACKATGAEAVHPGYGFLSENEAFCAALEREGIVFIGPKAHAIGAMGDKIASKKLAKEAGVTTIPGWNDPIESPERAVEIARGIGYPVMIKASAGGGGKGLRVAFNDAEAHEGFASCVNEAKNAFNDDRVFIEKFVEEPRHIEIQVLGDGHGNVVYLNERECSIQRRHQKVIEEAPSPFIDPDTRRAMGEQAVRLAKAVQYQSAGTVEFVVGRDKSFYFLEMNTRLQVEHPVTELITGLDLVEQMIRVAAGEKLAFTQADVKLEGWAMEARICAEDPARGFLPSVGRLIRYRPPVASDRVRVDTGVFEGGEVSMHYDSMIAKQICYGATRAEAIAQLRDALDAFCIRGPNHNIAFVSAVLGHPRFASGDFTTAFIAEEYPHGYDPATAAYEDEALLVAVAATVHQRYIERASRIVGQLPGHEFRISPDAVVRLRGVEHRVHIENDGDHHAVLIDGVRHRMVSDWRVSEPVYRGEIDGRPFTLQVERVGLRYRLQHRGARVDAEVMSERAAELLQRMPVKAAPDLSRFLLSPMPGLLREVAVKPGQAVKAGERLAVIEAMKMENILRAERDGVIGKVSAQQGESLTVDQIILEFAAD